MISRKYTVLCNELGSLILWLFNNTLYTTEEKWDMTIMLKGKSILKDTVVAYFKAHSRDWGLLSVVYKKSDCARVNYHIFHV